MLREIWHLIRFGLRSLRWMSAAWAAMLAWQIVAFWIGPTPPAEAYLDLVRIDIAATVMRLAVLFVLVTQLVHADPLVGTQAFWTTRPIRPGRLLIAKLVVIAVVAFLVPAAWFGFAGVALGLPVELVRSMVATLLFEHAVGAGLTLVLATVSRGLAESFVWAIVCVVGSLVWAYVMRSAVSPRMSPMMGLETWHRVTGFVSATAAATVFAACVHQYFTRRRVRTVAIAVMGIAAAGLANRALGPPRIGLDDLPSVYHTATTNTVLGVEIVPASWETRSSFDTSTGPRLRHTIMAARLRPTTTVAGYYGPIGLRAEVSYSDGTRHVWESRGFGLPTLPPSVESLRQPVLQALGLPNPGPGTDDGNWKEVQAVMRLPEAEADRRKSDAGHLKLTIVSALMQYTPVIHCDLAEGAQGAGPAGRLRVESVERTPEGVRIAVREEHVASDGTIRAYALHDRRTGAVWLLDAGSGSSHRVGLGSRGLTVSRLVLTGLASRTCTPGHVPALGPESVIVVLTASPVGIGNTTHTIDPFYFDAARMNWPTRFDGRAR